MNKQNKLMETEAFFTAVADKTRLRLLNLLRENEVSVCLLAEILGESQPKISRHLACLKSAGIVEARRDGKWIYYKITEQRDAFARRVLTDTVSWLNSQESMRSEYEKLAVSGGLPETVLTGERQVKSEISGSTNMRKNQSRELETFLL